MRELQQYMGRERDLLRTTGKGRGVVRLVCHGQHHLSPQEIEGIRALITSEHEAGRQVFREIHRTWIREAYDIDM